MVASFPGSLLSLGTRLDVWHFGPVTTLLNPLSLADHVGEVRFNGRGITGYILFIETSPTSTRVIANLRGLPGKSQLSPVPS